MQIRGLIASLAGWLVTATVIIGAVSAFWLVLGREWDVLFGGFVFLVVGPWVLSLMLMPRLPIVRLAARFQNNALIAWILTAVAVLYTIAVITASSFFILGNLVAHAEPNTGVPALLWSYTAAMGPWVFLARRDKEVWSASSPADVMTLVAQIAYLSIVVLLLTVSVSLMAALVVFVLIMIAGGVASLAVLPDEVGH